MLTTSVIVPLYNGSHFLKHFIHSLYEALPENSEVILIDDASGEDVLSLFPNDINGQPVIKVSNDKNLGYCKSVNKGFELAKGHFLVQLNSDLILSRKTITSMLQLIGSNPKAGIIGSKLIYPSSNTIQHIGMGIGAHSKKHIYYGLPQHHPLCSKTRKMQIVSGATVAMTRKVLNKIGLLDERHLNHCEDMDHCLKALEAGYENYTCAESIAYHWESESGPARFSRQKESNAIFWTDWGHKLKPDLQFFVRESLQYIFTQRPELLQKNYIIINLCTSHDETIIIDELEKSLNTQQIESEEFRQFSDNSIQLPMVLPHWYMDNNNSFIYIVNHFSLIKDNFYWFSYRKNRVGQELIIDVCASALVTEELL